MQSKKSQGLPINVIIIAAIGLIVLIVILAIFSDKLRFLSKNIAGTCQDEGGKCALKCDENFPRRVIAKGCDKTGNVNLNEEGPCCLPSPIK